MQPVCILPLMLTAALLLLPSARAVDGVIDPEDPDPATTITIESSTDSELSGDDLDADEDDVSEFGRAAGVGHSSIAAGKQIPVQRPKVVIKKPILHPLPPPPFLNLGKPKKQPSLAVPLPIGVPPPPIGGPVPIGGFPAAGPELDPSTGLAFLEYIRYLLENYPSASGRCRGKCDFTRFKKCTCMSPAVYTPDGRGNCNLGVTKPDKQVWCYVNESHGHPLKVCPDSRESSSRPGLYWSRFACITE